MCTATARTLLTWYKAECSNRRQNLAYQKKPVYQICVADELEIGASVSRVLAGSERLAERTTVIDNDVC